MASSVNAVSGPSTSSRNGTTSISGTDLWSDILNSANRSNRGKGAQGRKNVVLLSERHHGRRYLLDQLTSTAASGSTSKRKNDKKSSGPELAIGYEVLQVRDESEEDAVPPISIFYPPSSHPSMMRLIPRSLPPKSLADTIVMIVLDWTRPSSMIRELITWLNWIENWASSSSEQGQSEEMRDKLQSHIQHYNEPTPQSTSSSTTNPTQPTESGGAGMPSLSSTYGSGPLLPLGQGTLTLNSHGIPIVVVCAKADLMDNVAEEIGMKGGGWEERTDWIQQVLRIICLAYGAAMFYTAPTQPSTYTLLRSYLLHRLYTVPPPLNPSTESPTHVPSTRFPFSHRANVLDRDAIMVPTGWDSYGKINVLREGFDPARVGKAWTISLKRASESQADEVDEEDEGIEDLWEAMIPDTEREPKPITHHAISTTSEPEQAFLARQLEILQKDPNRDPRASFRQAAAAVSASASHSTPGGSSSTQPSSGDGGAGVVGPMSAGGLNLPGVEKAMAEMEGGTAEDLKERFAKLGRRESTRPSALSPTTPSSAGSSGAVPNAALHDFFQGLLATKGKSSSSASSGGNMAPPAVPTGQTSPKPE